MAIHTQTSKMKYKLQFRSLDDAAGCAFYLSDIGYSVKLMGSALMVGQIDVNDLAITQSAFTAWIYEEVTEFDLAG